MSTPDTLSASCLFEANAVYLLGCIAESSTLSHQVASRKGTSLLALGGLCPRCMRILCAGFNEDVETPPADRFLAHETEVVY